MQVIRKCFGKYRFDKFTALPLFLILKRNGSETANQILINKFGAKKVDPDTTMNDHKTWHQIR
jgi:hypothetical protein